MPKDKITEYSATNASNTDVGGVNIDEGCLPSSVNNSIRELMTHLKNFSDGTDAIDALAVDNLKLDGNTISSTDTNGNITLAPNGTGEVNLADSDKLTFGAGSDLQIYHDGSNSYVEDAGTGRMFVISNGANISLSTPSDIMLKAINDGAVELYYDNSKKLETTSSGVTITGDITANNLAIENTPVVTARKGSNQSVPRATWTKITGITSSEYDSDSAWNGSRFTVPSGKAGRYLISAYFALNFQSAGGDGEQAIGAIYVNGSSIAQVTRLSMNNGGRHMSHFFGTGAIIANLSVSDYVELYAYMQDDAQSGTLNVVGGSGGTRFGIMRIN